MSWKGDYAGDGTLRVGRVDLVCSRVRKVSPAGLEEKKETVRPAKSEKTEEIREKEVRVIDTDGTMLGVMPTQQAMDLANEKKLDLVNISPNAKPPVCKILDYGKYRYELQKKEKEARKKQKTTQVKEIRLSTFIEEHDIQVKANTAAKFLKDGDKVKVSLRFRGRERDYAAKGMDVMRTFAESVSEVGVIEKKPLFEGRSLTMVLGPKAEK